ncbi:MAG: response regulator transcription factor [Deltaproteobacteria bacterium]|nr:response regulator transcription factor [Deltaproteobacteria bacterium]
MKRTLTFLVATRDADHRRGLAARLEEHGTILRATSVDEARSLIEGAKDALDALIVDAALDGGRGLDVVELVRARQRGICALVVARAIDGDLATRALEVGARPCIAPLDPRHLAVAIEEAATRRDAFDRRVHAVLDRWKERYRLTPVEEDLLRRAVHGETRQETAARRKVAAETVRKQVQAFLRKKRAATFDSAVADLLREACGQPR